MREREREIEKPLIYWCAFGRGLTMCARLDLISVYEGCL